MRARFVLAPQAAADLADIWRYIKNQSTAAMADHVESVIRDKFAFLSETPEAGHHRRNLTNEEVKFFPVYSYLIVLPARHKASADSCDPSRSARRRAGPQRSALICRAASRLSATTKDAGTSRPRPDSPARSHRPGGRSSGCPPNWACRALRPRPSRP